MSTVEPKRRGRPRAYDPDTALQRAMDVFWRAGYNGTSLDAIAAATGMNRPSLYAAFGDKRELYLKALGRYWELALADLRMPLTDPMPLQDALMRAYEGALSIYLSGAEEPRGCFVLGTAVTSALEDMDVRRSLSDGIRKIDADFEARFRVAQEHGELGNEADPAALAILATATMHTLAVRARAGAPRAELTDLARKAVKAICR